MGIQDKFEDAKDELADTLQPSAEQAGREDQSSEQNTGARGSQAEQDKKLDDVN